MARKIPARRKPRELPRMNIPRSGCFARDAHLRTIAQAMASLSCVVLALLSAGRVAIAGDAATQAPISEAIGVTQPPAAGAEATQHPEEAEGGVPHAAAYEDLLEVTGVFAEARASAQTLVARLSEENPVVPAAVWTGFAAKIADRDTLASLYVPIYARHLTEADAEGLLAFYRSPLGERWLQILPQVQQEYRAEAERWAGTIAEDLLGGSTKPDDVNAEEGAVKLGDRRVASIHELLRVSGSLEQASHTMSLMIDRLRQAPQASQMPGSFWEQARNRLVDEKSLLQLWTSAYARHVSNDDVRAMIDFYRSALGKRYVAALPDIRREALDAATRLANTAARRAVREVLGPLPQYRLQRPELPREDSEPSKNAARDGK